MRHLLILLLLLGLRLSALGNLLDLKEMDQGLVLETKEIQIPGYPQAFNPSLIRWKGSLWMSFRSYNRSTFPINTLGMIRLDENFNPAGDPQILNILEVYPGKDVKAQDIRLAAAGESLYIVYNKVNPQGMRRICVARLQDDGGKFAIVQHECLNQFPGMLPGRNEKNWVPFSYNDNLLLAYSLNPHRILGPFTENGSCDIFAETTGKMHWEWGELRGGTSALLDGDHYLALFHSCKRMATKQSQGKAVKHYLIGAYTFAAHPPFLILRISQQPIIESSFYKGNIKTLWGTMRVLFPGGLIVDEEFIWVAYGKQDREIWIAKMDKKRLLESLVTVERE